MALSQQQYAEWMANPDLAALGRFQGVEAPAPIAAPLAVTPPVTMAPPAPQSTSPVEPSQGFDAASYLAVNPDLVASWESGGRLRELGPSMEEAAARHWIEQGSGEGRQGAPSLAVRPGELDDSLRVFGDSGATYGGHDGAYTFGDQSISAQDYAKLLTTRNDPFAVANAPGAQAGGRTDVPVVTGAAGSSGALPAGYNGPLDFDSLSKLAVGAPTEFGMYSGSAADYRPPQLMPANDRFATPYYAAMTNDGDLAGAVMAGPGQGIRLVDAKTGQVVFEGTGPEAAQQAVGIANAVSDDRGRKAAWRIEADYGDKGWVAQAAERYDPKRPSLFGTLLDIAAPFILGALFPPLAGLATAWGATGAAATIGNAALLGALANTGSGLVQGESLGTAARGGVTAGALSGLTAGALGRLPTSVTAPINNVTRGVSNVVNQGVDLVPGLRAVLDPINQGLTHIIDASGAVVGTVRGGVDAARDAVQGAVRGGVDGILGTGGPTVNGLPSPGYVNFNVTPADLAAGFDPFTVAGVDIVGGGGGAIMPGLPVGFSPQPVTGNEIEGVDIVAERQDPLPTVTGIDPVGGDPSGGVDLEGVTITGAPPPQPGIPTPSIPPPAPVDFVNTPADIVGPDGMPDTTPLPPPQTVGGGVLPGVPTPPPATGGGYSLPTGIGTRASLSPIFSASLPPPTFGSRTPRDVTVDKRYAIERPEASFFSNVPQRTASDFAVMSPSAALLAGVGDLDGDGVVTDADRALWKKRFAGQGYADGGFAVGGMGDGRSDDIEARLSDGEYVIDAETVALLGNGSSKAGADALDRFRVEVRKHKGRDLAKGKFSAGAREPMRYLEAR